MSNIISRKPRGTPFQPGASGNPIGRPKGSRNAFSAAFIGDMQASWAQHGPSVLDQVAKRDPSRYLGIAASLCPRDVAVSIEQRLPGNMDVADWAVAMECFGAIRQAIPDAGARQPGEVMAFVLEAIQAHDAHDARLIEGQLSDNK